MDTLPFNPRALKHYSDAHSVTVSKAPMHEIRKFETPKFNLCASCLSPNAELIYQNAFIDITGSEDNLDYHCHDCGLYTYVRHIYW